MAKNCSVYNVRYASKFRLTKNDSRHYIDSHCLQFYGLHPFVVKNSVTKVAKHVNTATTIGSAIFGSFAGLSAQKAAAPTPETPAQTSSWSKWAPAAYAVGGALVAGAAAGGAYYKKDDLTQGWSWATDHMKYVGSLWDEKELQERVEALIDIEAEHGVVFRKLVSLHLPTLSV